MKTMKRTVTSKPAAPPAASPTLRMLQAMRATVRELLDKLGSVPSPQAGDAVPADELQAVRAAAEAVAACNQAVRQASGSMNDATSLCNRLAVEEADDATLREANRKLGDAEIDCRMARQRLRAAAIKQDDAARVAMSASTQSREAQRLEHTRLTAELERPSVLNGPTPPVSEMPLGYLIARLADAVEQHCSAYRRDSLDSQSWREEAARAIAAAKVQPTNLPDDTPASAPTLRVAAGA